MHELLILWKCQPTPPTDFGNWQRPMDTEEFSDGEQLNEPELQLIETEEQEAAMPPHSVPEHIQWPSIAPKKSTLN